MKLEGNHTFILALVIVLAIAVSNYLGKPLDINTIIAALTALGIYGTKSAVSKFAIKKNGETK